MAIVLWLMWRYLDGEWWPRSTSETRHACLRAKPVPWRTYAWTISAGVLSIAALAGLWIVLFSMVRMRANALPEFSKYPLITIVLVGTMASLFSPLTEEAAFRGYCQTILERRFSGVNAVTISSLLFAFAHLTQGLFWPKLLVYFLAGLVFGLPAYLCKSTLPTKPVHITADLTFRIRVVAGRPQAAGVRRRRRLSVSSKSGNLLLAQSYPLCDENPRFLHSPCTAGVTETRARRNATQIVLIGGVRHAGYKIAVMFHGMHIVKIQHAEFGHVHANQLLHLSARRVCQTVISLVTIGNGILQRWNKISFRRLGLLDLEPRNILSECYRTKRILCFREMSPQSGRSCGRSQSA
jgi:membrane protease YdiL (CAAX protease family)